MMLKLRALCAVVMLSLAFIAGHVHTSVAQAVQVPNAKQCFQATTGVNGFVGTLGAVTGGAGGISGVYGGVALTGGSGTGATANITVSGAGVVTSVAIQSPGQNYVVGDVLSAASVNIGGVTGFSVPVASISINSSLAGGTVAMYVPGTLTTKQTWQNSNQSTPNTNPITLDANGCAVIYGVGTYRQILYDSLGNEVWDQPTTVTPVNPFYADTAGGTANVITVNDGNFSGTDGQAISFLAAYTNTGAVTLNASSYGAISVVKNTSSGLTALKGGEIVAGNLVTVTYSSVLNKFIDGAPISSTTYPTINVLDYGGDPNGVNSDNDSPFALWWTACMLSHSGAIRTGAGGNDCYMPAGHYKFTSSATWDFANNTTGGGYIHGAGSNSTVLDFTTTNNTQLLIENSANGAYLYPMFANFGVTGNFLNAGGVLQIGQHFGAGANPTEILNGAILQAIWVSNAANTAASAGIEVNGFFNGHFYGVTSSDACPTNSGGGGECLNGGDALRLRYSAFSTYEGAFSAAGIGVHITGNGTVGSYANAIRAADTEVNFIDYKIDDANVINNTISNGQLVWCNSTNSCASGTGYAIVATAGSGNIFDNNHFGSGQAYNVISDGTCANNVGVLIRSSNVGINTPSHPATTVALQNCTMRRILVNESAGSVSLFCFGPAAGSCLGIPTTGGAFSYILNPQDSMKDTFTSTPGMTWTAVE